MFNFHSSFLLIVCVVTTQAKGTREFEGIEKFFPTNKDPDALESSVPIKLMTPDGQQVIRTIRTKGIVVDEPLKPSEDVQTPVTEAPIESNVPSTAASNESPASTTPSSPSRDDEDDEPRGEGRGTGLASARQFFYNPRLNPLENHAGLAKGGHAGHSDKQMVLVFAHSVEIPLVMTPQHHLQRHLYHQHPPHYEATASSQPGPRILYAQSRVTPVTRGFLPGNPYSPGFRAIPLGGMQAASSSPSIVRAAGVRILPVTRLHFYGPGNVAQESVRKVVFLHPTSSPMTSFASESRPTMTWLRSPSMVRLAHIL